MRCIVSCTLERVTLGVRPNIGPQGHFTLVVVHKLMQIVPFPPEKDLHAVVQHFCTIGIGQDNRFITLRVMRYWTQFLSRDKLPR